jgi:hypothetical protein
LIYYCDGNDNFISNLSPKFFIFIQTSNHKNRTASEIADWLDIPVEKVLSIIETIRKQGDN